MKISAYISVHDDWQILGEAMNSIIDIADEIIIVDGTYEWMAPLLESKGRDPSRSSSELYSTISRFGAKVKVVNGVWKNEVEKRVSGYEHCSGDYVLRADADEILFFDQKMVAAFIDSQYGVAEMEMPIYISPGYIKARTTTSRIERQCCLFKSGIISAAEHVSYLWLVMPDNERSFLAPKSIAQIFGTPIAFNAHLTHWRPQESALTRARFYVLNYLRSGGSIPWAPKLKYDQHADFRQLFEDVGAETIVDILKGNAIVAGIPDLGDHILRPTPLSIDNESNFTHLREKYFESLAGLNKELQNFRVVARGIPFFIDVSTSESLNALTDSSKIVFQFDDEITAVSAKLNSISVLPPYITSTKLETTVKSNYLIIERQHFNGVNESLQSSLELSVWTKSGSVLNNIKVG